MAIMDKVQEALGAKVPSEPKKTPAEIDDRISRGQARMKDGASRRNECLKFWRGQQYIYRGKNDVLVNQNVITLSDGGGKPPHRVRTTRNLIVDVVAHEVAAATQRVPGYEVNPSTSDPQDVSAARLAEKVARYGYDKWNVRKVTENLVTYAVVAGEGFVWPYWDTTVGPFISFTDGITGEESHVGQGEVAFRFYGPNEVAWEPGLKFHDSRWHVITQARPLQEVYDLENYIGGKLDPDGATEASGEKATEHSKLVMVTEYLERPCAKYPQGRWLTIANKKVIVDERPYPLADTEGNVLDEPVLHGLSYIQDPDSDRDFGLVEHLLDAQRTINDCTNKQLEWKNLALQPQAVIRNGEFKQSLTDEPGAVFHAVGSGEITWRPVPPIPGELSQIKDEAISDIARIAAQNDIPSQVESGRGIQAIIEKDATRRASFIANLAEFHSRLMRHALFLVSKHYTEPRLLKIRGMYAPERVSDFLGSQLKSQVDVTVLPGTIEPRTRALLEQKILAFADRGWISPEAAMAAINGGSAEALVLSYELDVARATSTIQKIREGPEVLFAEPSRPPIGNEVEMMPDPTGAVDPMSGQPQMVPIIDPLTGKPPEVPGWMPRPFDRVTVHKTVVEDFMKTSEWDTFVPEQKEATLLYYQALLDIEAEQAAREAAMQMQQASDLGMANAAKPQSKGKPDQAGTTDSEGKGQMFGPRYQFGATSPF